jgi:hypothetical protein
MRMTNTERVTPHRHRKRLGLRAVTVIVSEQDIDYLLACGYQLSRVDADSIGKAVEAFLSRTFGGHAAAANAFLARRFLAKVA